MQAAIAKAPTPSTMNPQTARYAQCIEASKRVRWEIDRDVIRGRQFDYARKFLPDKLSLIGEFGLTDAAERRLLSQVQGRTYANMFGFVERFIAAKILEVTREQALADQVVVEVAGALRRRGAEAPGALPPPRGDDGRGHARGLHLPAQAQRRGERRARQVHLGRARAHLPHRALLGRALSREHRPRSGILGALEGRVPVPHEGGSQHAVLDEMEWRRENAKLTPRSATARWKS